METAEKQEEKCQVDIWLMESVSLESGDIKACEHTETDFFFNQRMNVDKRALWEDMMMKVTFMSLYYFSVLDGFKREM